MESPFDDSVGTDVSSMEILSHRANDTPSLSQLLEERTLSTQSVVTRVRISSSFFELLESKMPMFGSMLGGKAGTSGTSNQTGEGASKGARSKEGADQGAMSSDPQNETTLRKSSPPSKPARSTKHQRSFCLTFWCTSDAIARQWY